MDSTKLSLLDFADIPELDIMQRAKKFKEFYDDAIDRKHFYYMREALEGSLPVRKILDQYTGKIRKMIYLASNDYLNLTMHPKVIKAGIEALEKYGVGAGSAPLFSTTDLHTKLEKRIAKFKSCEASLIYTSGFGSNAGTLLALLNKRDVAILDTLVHASIVEGCSNTNIILFSHNKMSSLEYTLAKKVGDNYRTKLIIVDGVYSMDGDIAHLDKIVEIAKRYGAYVMVDDAHAIGVLGKNGRGTTEHFNIMGKVDIVAGTFSKGLGVVGGFIASNKEMIELLRFYSRSYIFSTAMTPQAAGSLLAGIDVIEDEPELREKLWENIRYFRENLISLGFKIGNAETAIFPIIIGDDLKVKEITRCLHERDIYVNPVMFPAVSKKSSRIRMSIMATHTKEHLDIVLNALEDIGKKFGIKK